MRALPVNCVARRKIERARNSVFGEPNDDGRAGIGGNLRSGTGLSIGESSRTTREQKARKTKQGDVR
jgi:hypothetical protein